MKRPLLAVIVATVLALPAAAETPPVLAAFPTGFDSNPGAPIAGSDGNLWAFDNGCPTCASATPPAIDRITPDGTITEYPASVPANSQPFGITTGPDGNLWFGNDGFLGGPSYIGRFALPGIGISDVALVASVLPASRSVAIGTPANVFATVINHQHRHSRDGLRDRAGHQASRDFPLPDDRSADQCGDGHAQRAGHDPARRRAELRAGL